MTYAERMSLLDATSMLINAVILVCTTNVCMVPLERRRHSPPLLCCPSLKRSNFCQPLGRPQFDLKDLHDVKYQIKAVATGKNQVAHYNCMKRCLPNNNCVLYKATNPSNNFHEPQPFQHFEYDHSKCFPTVTSFFARHFMSLAPVDHTKTLLISTHTPVADTFPN